MNYESKIHGITFIFIELIEYNLQSISENYEAISSVVEF